VSEPSLRHIPAVNEVLAADPLRDLGPTVPRPLLLETVRAALEELRCRVRQGLAPPDACAAGAVAQAAADLLRQRARPKVRSVINATGVLLHTNLGRAPLAAAAAQAASAAGRGYLNLEMDLATGQRSSRQDLIREWLCRLTGAAAATAVNNNAAATVSVLRALAQGREVIVSRGQLVEIGGSFRIPEIMAVSGAVLREVGTTNITRLSDYAAAITNSTAALLRVHHSNYQIVGHVETPRLAELVALGRQHYLPVIDDIGSGALFDLSPWGLRDEPVAAASVAAGADLVLFSGDKLLGGPQAGLIVGRADLIQKIERDPLTRAFRLDKMTLAALEATLRLCLDPRHAWAEIPLLRMLSQSAETLRQRADWLAARIQTLCPGVAVAVHADQSFVGGGTTPNQPLPTWVVAVRSDQMGANELARRLRLGQPAVVARVQADGLLLDPRAVFPEQEEPLAQAVAAALQDETARRPTSHDATR
jgi:L-seryl-tRNA(Ser) seleniumtransferase